MNVERRRQVVLVAVALIVLATGFGWSTHDGLSLAALVLAGGLLWTARGWKAWALATPMALTGLVWSALDVNGCSLGSRARLFYEKAAGHLPFITWSEVRRAAFTRPCFASYENRPEITEQIRLLEHRTVQARSIERYATPLGEFWIPAPGKELLAWLLWEITAQQIYESGDARIRTGDTVIDCGAHIGVFTRYALSRGAARVVAVEPDPTNLAALDANFAPEIAAGRVLLIRAGVWDEKTFLTLSDSTESSARHSFVTHRDSAEKIEGIPVLPLDQIVAGLGLDRVDFIKMDIEGAERRALAGARQTLERFHPRLAICTYHLRDDTAAVPRAVLTAYSPYQVHAKDPETGFDRFVTKVMFFHVP
jgi:FkbM family methyltransferase